MQQQRMLVTTSLKLQTTALSIALRSINESLYTAYIDVISKTVIGFSEDDSRTDDDNVTKAYEVYHVSCDFYMTVT